MYSVIKAVNITCNHVRQVSANSFYPDPKQRWLTKDQNNHMMN